MAEREWVAVLCARCEVTGAAWNTPIADVRSAQDEAEQLLRRTVAANGGLVMESTSDGVCALFGEPSNALATAVDLQLALHEADWGAAGAVCAAIALHAVPEVADDVIATARHVATRVAGAAHVGQIVLSEAAALVARRDLLGEMALRSLATVMVCGESLALVQLTLPQLPAAFPPLKLAAIRGDRRDNTERHAEVRFPRVDQVGRGLARVAGDAGEHAAARLRDLAAWRLPERTGNERTTAARSAPPAGTAAVRLCERPVPAGVATHERAGSAARQRTRRAAVAGGAAVAFAASTIACMISGPGAWTKTAAVSPPLSHIEASTTGSLELGALEGAGIAEAVAGAENAVVTVAARTDSSAAEEPAPEGSEAAPPAPPAEAQPTPQPILIGLIRAAAARRGLEAERLLRIARCESELDARAVNAHDGSLGLFQFQPGTWEEASPRAGYAGHSPFDPLANVEVAAYLMARGEFWRWTCQ